MNTFRRATILCGNLRQEFWCSECDGVKVDSEDPETGAFFYVAGEEWLGDRIGSRFPTVIFALCRECLPRFSLDAE